MTEIELSIVFGTSNRLVSLERCVDSVRRACGDLVYEIIVVDGCSTDGTREYLLQRPNLRPHFEAKRRGAVAAFNAGYRMSRAPFVALLNDDVEVEADALEFAVRYMTARPGVGQTALAYKKPEALQYRTYTIHGKPYANLGIIRREAAEDATAIQGALWNPRYHTYAADTELSCWLHKLGWGVEPLLKARCIDYEIRDVLRIENNSGRNRLDSCAFGRKWPSAQHIEPDGPFPLASEEELGAFQRLRDRKRPS